MFIVTCESYSRMFVTGRGRLRLVRMPAEATKYATREQANRAADRFRQQIPVWEGETVHVRAAHVIASQRGRVNEMKRIRANAWKRTLRAGHIASY